MPASDGETGKGGASALTVGAGGGMSSEATAGTGGAESQCPAEGLGGEEDAARKIGAADFWRTHPDRVNDVAVWLQEDGQFRLPACPGNDDAAARCAARDAALLSRRRENADHVQCILDGLGFRLTASPVWYDSPSYLASGEPVPIVRAFKVGLDWSQVERVAQSPLVSTIAPPPGGAAEAGYAAPSIAECPDDLQASDGGTLGTEAKLAGIASLEGKGRQPVIIEVVDEGVLPPAVPCANDMPCQDATNSLWERTIFNTRHITCLKRRIDQLVSAPSPAVPHATLLGSLLAPAVPPLNQAPNTLKAFGAGLTFEESQQLAKHPYVEGFWTDPGIQFRQPERGCPPDLTAPLPVTLCSEERTSSSGKITETDELTFMSGGATQFEVILAVDGGAQVCPLERCSQLPCPARAAVLSRWQAENFESQRCVRALIESLGGTSSMEVFLGNSFAATLTWDQVQAVAAHPHVLSISHNVASPPP